MPFHGSIRPTPRKVSRSRTTIARSSSGRVFHEVQETGHDAKHRKRRFQGGQFRGHDRRPGAQERTPRLVGGFRSEEHTSELQSLMRSSYTVFCLKKKKNTRTLT